MYVITFVPFCHCIHRFIVNKQTTSIPRTFEKLATPLLVVDICCQVLPEHTSKIQQEVDIVHRLGRKTEGNATRGRTVIIQFLSRSLRDMIWKAAKSSAYLKAKELRFGEDLTSVDKAIRKELWPKVEAPRQV